MSAAPLRISFLGGGTDLPHYSDIFGGRVITTSINKYVYVHLKHHDPLFQERYRISYSEVEHCQNRNEIQNKIVKACLEILEIDEPLQISTSADLPAKSGLGSSSSFCVALLAALIKYKGGTVDKSQIAELACKVEIEILEQPIGKQDQYASCFGGFNLIHFDQDKNVRIENIAVTDFNIKKFLYESILIWTEKERDANSILQDQVNRSSQNLDSLHEIQHLTTRAEIQLRQNKMKFQDFRSFISESWEHKKKLSPLIESEEVRRLFSQLSLKPTDGVKLLGAGGGGFVLVSRENGVPHLDSEIKSFVPEFEDNGVRIISAES